MHAQDSVGGGGDGGARPSSASSHDGKDVKKSIVSPVGQYIKTGQLPVAKVRGSTSCLRASTSCMGTIQESSESLVRSPVFILLFFIYFLLLFESLLSHCSQFSGEHSHAMPVSVACSPGL